MLSSLVIILTHKVEAKEKCKLARKVCVFEREREDLDGGERGAPPQKRFY